MLLSLHSQLGTHMKLIMALTKVFHKSKDGAALNLIATKLVKSKLHWKNIQ
jgi:hypothetical protein